MLAHPGTLNRESSVYSDWNELVLSHPTVQYTFAHEDSTGPWRDDSRRWVEETVVHLSTGRFEWSAKQSRDRMHDGAYPVHGKRRWNIWVKIGNYPLPTFDGLIVIWQFC